MVNIVQDINNYKIPNTYVVLCKSQDNIKNKDYYKQYIYINRNNKLAKNILLKCENIDVTTSLSLDIHRRNINNFLRSKEVNYVFLDQYLQQLIAYFNILRNNIINNDNKNSETSLLNRLTNISKDTNYYGQIVCDILRCFDVYFVDNPLSWNSFSSLLGCCRSITKFEHRNNISYTENYRSYINFEVSDDEDE